MSQTGSGRKINMKNMQQPEGMTNSSSEIEGICIQSGLSMAAGNVDLYNRLLNQFLSSYSDHIPRIKDALKLADLKTAERMVHNIKSASGYIGANTLFRTSEKLERQIRNNHVDRELLNLFFNQLEQVIVSIGNHMKSD